MERLKLDGLIYEEALLQAEIMNSNFQLVFTKKSYFVEREGMTSYSVLREIKVEVKVVHKLVQA